MAKVFFPRDFILVDSNSSDHPPNTQYKVSIGAEDWNGKHVDVIKVQMVYEGRVSGRRSPSYPIGSDDYDRVHEAVMELKERFGIEMQKCRTGGQDRGTGSLSCFHIHYRAEIQKREVIQPR